MAHHRGLGLRRNPAASPARQCYTAVMCGRFYLTATAAELRRLFKLEKVPELVPRYNIAPMQSTPIVVAEENGRAVLTARWGLVPANGFYEWQARGTKKQPYKITLRHGALIAFAGLWARWAPEDGDPVETFAIVTTRASKLVSEVHDRMPVIVAPTDYQRWLTAPAARAKKLLLPYA